MKKALSFVPFLLLAFACTSCKKETPEPNRDETKTDTIYNPYNGKLDGFFCNSQSENISSTNIHTFYSTPYAFFGDPHSAAGVFPVDSVTFNNTPLQLASWDGFYHQYLQISTPESHWWVKGHNGIPDFEYVNSKGIPYYDGCSLFPETIDHSKELTISISGLRNAHVAWIELVDYTCTISVNRSIGFSTSSVTFTVEELSKFPKDIRIAVHMVNENIQHIDGKIFNFYHSYSIYKAGVTIY